MSIYWIPHIIRHKIDLILSLPIYAKITKTSQYNASIFIDSKRHLSFIQRFNLENDSIQPL